MQVSVFGANTAMWQVLPHAARFCHICVFAGCNYRGRTPTIVAGHPNHPLTPPPPCVYASGVNLRQALRAARWMLGDLFIRSTPTPTVDAAEQLANREAEIDVWEEKEL